MTITQYPLVDPKCEVTNSDYDAIESALMESSRGRRFLSEYARRIRHTGTDLLLSAIYSSANQIGSPPASQPSQVVSNVADECCNNKLNDIDQHGPRTRSHEEYVSRY